MLIDNEVVLGLELRKLSLKLLYFLAHGCLKFISFTVLQFELLVQIIDLQLIVG